MNNTFYRDVLHPKELLQGAIGAFTAVLLFFSIRGGDPFFFNPNTGLLITITLVLVYWAGFKMRNKLGNFVVNFIIAFAISGGLGYTFDLITYDQLFSFDVFGSLIIIGVWLAFPTALLFDRNDFTNPLKRQFVRRKI